MSWGQGHVDNSIGWGQGDNNDIGWGEVYGSSASGDTALSGVYTDADAQAFITAASITDPTQQSAVNQLVVDLKAASIWTKMKAVYPFVGGTASSHKFNLLNPADTNGAYRLTFSGGFTHDSGGVKGNGSNAFATTYLAGNDGMGQDDYHATVYSRTNVSAVQCDLGLYSSGFGCSMYTSESGSFRVNSMGASQVSYAYAGSSGFYFQSRYTSGNLIYGKTTSQNSVASNSVNLKTSNWIGWRTGDYNGEYSERQLAFMTIGKGLNGTELTSLYNAIQTFQTTLSRQV